MPDKFKNVTNGIAHRRWLNQANPGLASLVTELIGDGYVYDAAELKKLMAYKNDLAVLEKLKKIKLENKKRLAAYVKQQNGVVIDPNSIFDCQVKRMHEYKRQLLNGLPPTSGCGRTPMPTSPLKPISLAPRRRPATISPRRLSVLSRSLARPSTRIRP